LEVDLLILAGGRLHPVEIKLTATPTVRHVAPLNRLKSLLGEEAASEGILVCTGMESRPLPGTNRSIPWQEFPHWISRLPRMG
jgi:negative regulator of sigma E activity